jgi:hypothetical protein
LALLLGVLHTVVAHSEALEKLFMTFLFYDQMNASGTGLALLCAGVTLTSLPGVRRTFFQVFYYVHIVVSIF